MNSHSTPRKLRPSEVARQDQYEAMAGDLASSDPHAAVFTTIFAPVGTRCCWCDCPDELHEQAGYACPTCPTSAYYVVKAELTHTNYPICAGHYDDFNRFMKARLREVHGNIPHAVLAFNVLDEDQPS